MERFDVLKKLIEFSEPVDELSNILKSYSWDYDGEPIVLTASHIRSVLKRFLIDELDPESLEKWANVIECREDIDFEENNHMEIDSVIHYLANSKIEGALTKGVCVNMLAT
ncbi:hypothetical protein ACT3R7_20735, partial [Halomonas sp. AOP43-A1-21]